MSRFLSKQLAFYIVLCASQGVWADEAEDLAYGCQEQTGRADAMLQTSEDCNPDLGRLSMSIDPYGAFGFKSKVGDACFDPRDELINGSYRRTVFESMPFLCYAQAG